MYYMTSFYKPEWTCGRYNPKRRVALMYNLIVGESFFFEDFSAVIISFILSLPSNSKLEVDNLVKLTNLQKDEIFSFLEELYDAGLLTKQVPSSEMISHIRKQVSLANINSMREYNSDVVGFDISSEIDDAENAYNINMGSEELCCAVLELTYECSARCIHCYNPGATRNDKEINNRFIADTLSLNEYKYLIDELYELGCYKVILTGGDPFSNPLVWEIIDYISNKGIAFDINTNGINLGAQLGKLLNYYPRSISVSLYSAFQKDHEKITRIKGSFNKTLSTIKIVSEHGIPLIIKCCIMRSNVKTYFTVEKIAKQYGAKIEFEVGLIDSLDGDHCVSNFLLLAPDMFEIVLRDKRVNLYVGIEKDNFGSRKKDMDERTCRAGVTGLCISPNGNLRLCVAHPHILGNIRDNSISNIIQTNEYMHVWKKTTLKDFESCGKFEYCDFCIICAGNNYSYSGDILKPCKNNCYIAKCRQALAKKLECGIDPLCGKTLEERLSSLDDTIPSLRKVTNRR